MQFGSDHYVPVLKIKRAEKAALSAIGNAHAGAVTPLLEVVKRKSDTPLNRHLDTAFKDLAQSLSNLSRCFLDPRELEPDGDSAALDVYERAASELIDFVPVVGLSRTAGLAPALEFRNGGTALRLTRAEMEAGSLSSKITAFLKKNQLPEESIDLIMDLGDVGEMVPIGVSALATRFLQSVPKHAAWRTFTISGCAFPKSMAVVGRNSFHLADRSEWVCWRDTLHAKRKALTRLPTFSDCAIQHLLGVEDFDPRTMAPSASARYTAKDHWLLVKGVSVRKILPSLQFPKIAQHVAGNSFGKFYRGPKHCLGCKCISDAANGAPRLGSLEAWRRIGTMHHITTVLEDLGSLRWP